MNRGNDRGRLRVYWGADKKLPKCTARKGREKDSGDEPTDWQTRKINSARIRWVVTYFAARKRDNIDAIFIRQRNTITRCFHACKARARKNCAYRWNLFERVHARQRAEQFVQTYARITCARKISTCKNRQIVLHYVERGISGKHGRMDGFEDGLQLRKKWRFKFRLHRRLCFAASVGKEVYFGRILNTSPRYTCRLMHRRQRVLPTTYNSPA